MSFRCFSRSSSSSFFGFRSRCSAQMWSSSEKPDCEPVLRYSSRRSSDSRSSSRRCSFSPEYSSIVSSTFLRSSSRSVARASSSTHVTIDAAK